MYAKVNNLQWFMHEKSIVCFFITFIMTVITCHPKTHVACKFVKVFKSATSF